MLDPTASEENARFHVLTWPWFIMAPFKMKGEGITLSDYQTVHLDNKKYHLMKQSFASGMGDAPDDWYRFMINTKTNRIDAMIYIVTYGKDAKEACLRRLDACPGTPDLWNLVADLWEEDLKVIGFIPVGRGSEPRREYDPHLNPVGFAEELAWKIQHPGPDREDYEKICNAVFTPEEINAQDGLEDKEGFIKHMLRYLPGGDNVREYS